MTKLITIKHSVTDKDITEIYASDECYYLLQRFTGALGKIGIMAEKLSQSDAYGNPCILSEFNTILDRGFKLIATSLQRETE